MITYGLFMNVRCDRPLIETTVPSQRTIEWIVKASESQRPLDRAPLNLALVLDRSGSMSGDKLAFVQQAACHVLDQLDERDRVAVVAYDDEVTLVAPSTAISGEARQDLQRRIKALIPGGWTDLSGGWLKGCAEVAERQQADGVNRALLLTDGLANRGMTDIEELTHHARELRRRGISTSTFGVGLDFNEQLLEALASTGGGHFFYIERPDQIPGFFRTELGELLSVIARETVLTIEVPAGLAAELLGDLPHERTATGLRIVLGDLSAGEERALYTRVLTPPADAGRELRLRGALAYKGLDGKEARYSAELLLRYAVASEVEATPPDRAVLERASQVEVATAAAQALKLERAGQREQAAQVMRQSLAANAPHMPAPAAASYASLADQMAQAPLSEEQRKESHFAAYKQRNTRK